MKLVESAAKPFVKWVGGKSQLIEQLEALLPADFDRWKDVTYIEPFVGGGAMLFYMLQAHPNIQKAINKGWRLLKPLKGDSKVVLAAPKGYKVRAYGESGPGDYVWGAVGEDGSYARPTNSMDRYAARQWYEKQARELNKGTKKKK